MKAVVLAGGFGTRLAEETEVKPKPMVHIGEEPILWHILKHYSHFGVNEFYIALGYLGDEIKRYFVDRHTLGGSMTIDATGGTIKRTAGDQEKWKLHLVETGQNSNTGGRLLRLKNHLKNGPFLLTYGDGVSNVDIDKLVAFHKQQGLVATVTAVRPPARFGGLVLDGGKVTRFSEKPQTGEGWINGGFMVFEPAIFDYLKGDGSILEAEALEQLADEGNLAAYQHEGFWQCMDTLRDKRQLESIWKGGQAPWKLWT